MPPATGDKPATPAAAQPAPAPPEEAAAAPAEPEPEPEPGAQKLTPDELLAESAQRKPGPGAADAGSRVRDPSPVGAGGPSPDEPPTPDRPRAPSPSQPEPAIGGDPLPIPGGEVTFQSARVRRFLDSGGASFDGRLVDADTGRAIAGADIEAWMGTRSVEGESDGEGRFRFEGLVPSSRLMLWITAAPTYVQERTEVQVPEQKTSFQSTFKLLSRAAATGALDGGAGMFLTRRGSRTIVTGLAAFGPAEKAGVRVGDAIVGVGNRKVGELGPGAIDYLLRGTIGSELELHVQTGSHPPRRLVMRRSAR